MGRGSPDSDRRPSGGRPPTLSGPPILTSGKNAISGVTEATAIIGYGNGLFLIYAKFARSQPISTVPVCNHPRSPYMGTDWAQKKTVPTSGRSLIGSPDGVSGTSPMGSGSDLIRVRFLTSVRVRIIVIGGTGIALNKAGSLVSVRRLRRLPVAD